MKYIFVHGLGQNASSWDKTKECLADKLEMVIPELSEFIREGNCTYSKIYSSFCEYCNAFSEPVHLCGLSLGAVLALNYAIDFPQKAGSLVHHSMICLNFFLRYKMCCSNLCRKVSLRTLDSVRKILLHLQIPWQIWISQGSLTG